VGEDAGVTIAVEKLPLVNKQKITIGILCVLLLLRLTDAYLILRIWSEYAFFYYVLITFPLLVFILWLNSENLQILNIDIPFILLFILLGVLLCWYYWSTFLGIVTGLGTLIVFDLFRRRKFIFEKMRSNSSLIIITLVGLIPVVLVRAFDSDLLLLEHFSNLNSYDVGWLFTSRLWGVIYEEMLFRGMLWMTLKSFKVDDKKILFIQAFLFWLAHISTLPSLSFWTTVPLAALWYGFLVLSSKSLTSSTITHFIYNLSAALLKTVR
jgi:membrane protease YdiL (CAAX protease family)